MNNSPLEFLAQKYGNVVKYDVDGNPSVFVKFPKMKSSELNPALPDHTHPAFIINGVEQDYILLGKYTGSQLVENGTIYSLPNMPPAKLYADNLLTHCRAFGNGASGLTVADMGFLLLLAEKNGWVPEGNDRYGNYSGDASAWDAGQSYSANDMVGYCGWLYRCVNDHESSAELRPENNPLYWEKQYQIGGVEANPADRDGGKCKLTLCGSGPYEWYLDGKPSSMADIVGNAKEIANGYRTVGGEIQILQNNDAAMPESDLSENSGAWKAILPNANDNGYTLVAPGTSGTLKWNYSNQDAITLDTESGAGVGDYISTPFKNIAVNSANVPQVPSILYELGLLPILGSVATGSVTDIYWETERLFFCGGDYSGNAGLFPAEIGLGTKTSGIRISNMVAIRPRMLAE